MRDKEHKKIKDLCDIFALLWYSNEKPELLKEKTNQFMPCQTIRKTIKIITEADYQKTSTQLNHTIPEVKRVLELLI